MEVWHFTTSRRTAKSCPKEALVGSWVALTSAVADLAVCLQPPQNARSRSGHARWQLTRSWQLGRGKGAALRPAVAPQSTLLGQKLCELLQEKPWLCVGGELWISQPAWKIQGCGEMSDPRRGASPSRGNQELRRESSVCIGKEP